MTTPADTGTPRPAPRPEHRPAPWVRTRLRTAPLAAALMAALAFVTVLLAAAFPRAVDRGTDDALREFLHDRGPSWTSLLATGRHQYDAADLDRVAAKLASYPNETFRFVASGPVYGTRSNKSRPMLNTGYARPDEVPPQLDLVSLHGLTDRVALVAGQWPGAGGGGGPVPIAISKAAADTIGMHLGDLVDAGSSLTGEPVRAEVVGVYVANDPDDPYWVGLPCPERACREATAKVKWRTGGVVSPDATDRIAPWGGGATDFWRLPVDTAALRADQLDRTKEEISSYLAGSTALRLTTLTGREDLRVGSELPELFGQAVARRDAAAPLAAVGPAGLAGVAVVVLCLAAGLAGDRRHGELALLQARGGSRGGVVRRLLGEGAVTVVPAAVVATGLVWWWLPTPRWWGSMVAALVVLLLAALGLPVRAALLWSARRAPGGWRRLVGELVVGAVTVAAVLEVRRRGVVPPGDGLDPLLVAAPLLLALTGGLVLARVQPVLVGLLARAAGRGPGVVGFLGLARAARGSGGRPRPSVLPVFALMLAVTTAGFGATVLDAVDRGRAQAVRSAVGGDAVVGAPTGAVLPPGFLTAAGALPGVRTATAVWWDNDVFLLGSDAGPIRVSTLVVDPRTYAELSRAVGRGAFDPAALAGDDGGIDTPVPALFSTELARRIGDGGYRLRMPNGWELLARSAGTLDGTPALESSTRRFVVLPAGPSTARFPELKRANLWFATGDIDERQLKGLMRELAPVQLRDGSPEGAAVSASASGSTPGPAAAPSPSGTAPAAQAPAESDADAVPTGYLVRTSAARSAELANDPLQHSAARLFWAAVIGAAGFALLAVLLTLLRAAPERAAVLARLRTMGLRPRQGLALIVAETLPQTLAAAVGGGVVAWIAVALLGPAIDLSALVGAPVPTGLRPALLPVLFQVLGLAALVTAGVLAEALISGRRQISTELRAGDQR
ncbi:hypothetical protein ABT263_26610 [Kitasatospora sp. NPDC001603]|uniref:hypothetical protein n=1 Tax=Kitasatospora sp. NPDC001603 TaxID=3154388 RepID=UPI003333A02E